MPHTASAKKRLRQSQRRRARNRATLKAIKKQLKVVDALATAGDMEKLKAEAQLAARRLDKAAAKRVVHPNQAARKKSQIARMLNRKQAAPAKA